MSTQGDTGIEFSLVDEEHRQHFRLLELPAELLNLLTSDKPPTLQFKSYQNASGEGHIVLCSHDKTYDIRQVSTSNSVFVSDFHDLSNEDGMPGLGLQAVAKCDSTLEVLPTKSLSAISYITTLLPAYTSTGFTLPKDPTTKSDFFSNIPLSEVECEAGWNELACFELGAEKYAVLPSATVRLKVWEALFQSATESGIDLTQPLNENAHATLIAMETDWPRELLEAVLRSMTNGRSGAASQIGDKTCAANVGRILLKDRTDVEGSVILASFMQQWADLLPEKWRTLADLHLIEGSYSLQNGEIAYNGPSTSSMSAAGADETRAGTKRKWHDKFRASKRA